MITFTLDTNCIIDVEQGRPSAGYIRALADAHRAGQADVAVATMSASEKQKDGTYIRHYDSFVALLRRLELDHLGEVYPMLYSDVSFLDRCLWATSEGEALERQIHDVLFPSLPFSYGDYCAACGLDAKADVGTVGMKWVNAKCDVQTLWSHINAGRNVFVTSDGNFHTPGRKPALIALGAGHISTPENTVDFL